MSTRFLRDHQRSESGVVLPTKILALCVSALALGGLLLVANNPNEAADKGTPASGTPTQSATAATSPSAAPSPSTPATKKPKPVKRGTVYVEVFNNSPVKGLAGRTASKVSVAGWKVVGTDNWYGTVDTTTIYYPPNLKRAGDLLGRDLGIKKIRPAIDPMRMDRLTLILTSDYH